MRWITRQLLGTIWSRPLAILLERSEAEVENQMERVLELKRRLTESLEREAEREIDNDELGREVLRLRGLGHLIHDVDLEAKVEGLELDLEERDRRISYADQTHREYGDMVTKMTEKVGELESDVATLQEDDDALAAAQEMIPVIEERNEFLRNESAGFEALAKGALDHVAKLQRVEIGLQGVIRNANSRHDRDQKRIGALEKEVAGIRALLPSVLLDELGTDDETDEGPPD